MIAIEFECNHCRGKGGSIGLLMDKPHIVCNTCEEIEEIMDPDIVSHCGELVE
jgi:Fe2+ or Zn2+ uptake regulation protein